MGRGKKAVDLPVYDERTSQQNSELLIRSCGNCFERIVIDQDYVCPAHVAPLDKWDDDSEECPFYRREPLVKKEVNGVAEYARAYHTPQEKLQLYVQYGCSVK